MDVYTAEQIVKENINFHLGPFLNLPVGRPASISYLEISDPSDEKGSAQVRFDQYPSVAYSVSLQTI